jgi:hypothetical protein
MGKYPTYSIPEGLDIKKLLKKCPPQIPNFEMEEELFIIECMTQGEPGDTFTLFIESIQEDFSFNPLIYIAWLTTCGVIESWIDYELNSSMIWHRFTKEYRTPIVEYQLRSRK